MLVQPYQAYFVLFVPLRHRAASLLSVLKVFAVYTLHSVYPRGRLKANCTSFPLLCPRPMVLKY